MLTQNPHAGKSLSTVLFIFVVAALVGLGATKNLWYSQLFPTKEVSLLEKLEKAQLLAHEDEHDHGEHAAGSVIALSENGLKNIGYEPFVVQLTDYQRKLTLPAIVAERPGRSQLHITAPLTGIVTKIHSVTGEAVEPGQLLFAIRMTHEDLVVAQRDYLRTVENLDVVDREIKRLNSLGDGVIAGKRVLEQEYEKQKLEASLHAESQAMLLHGLSEQQVDKIRTTRRLFRDVTVRVPENSHSAGGCLGDHPFQIQELTVSQGQQIEAGSHLAVLSDHCELLLEAIAFEDDALQIRQAVSAGQELTARPLSDSQSSAEITALEVLYVADKIDAESRAFKVFLSLPNRIVLDKQSKTGKRFVEWIYKPGQRMQIQVPVETWKEQIVLPTAAVVDEGAESYVYHQHGDHFDQVAVHVLHRDQDSVVVASDGALAAGNTIAGNGAYQIHLALKNAAGGGVDLHPGHSH